MPSLRPHQIMASARGTASSRSAKEAIVPFEYVSVDEAIKRNGLRMVVVGDVPSPWGEAAKGILHIKGIE